MRMTNTLTNQWFHTLEHMEAIKRSTTNLFVWVTRSWFWRNSIDMLQFDPYQEAQSGKQIASKTRWGLGEMVVLCLMESLLSKVNYDVFMDNYFTSFRLLMHLGAHDIRATVILNKKNLNNCIIIDDKTL